MAAQTSVGCKFMKRAFVLLLFYLAVLGAVSRISDVLRVPFTVRAHSFDVLGSDLAKLNLPDRQIPIRVRLNDSARASIDQIRIGHDLLVERGLRLREQRVDQSIGETGRDNARDVLRSFARSPIVEAALGFFPEVPSGDQLGQLFRRLRAFAEHLANQRVKLDVIDITHDCKLPPEGEPRRRDLKSGPSHFFAIGRPTIRLIC